LQWLLQPSQVWQGSLVREFHRLLRPFGGPLSCSCRLVAVRLLVVAGAQILHTDAAVQMNSLLWMCLRPHDAQNYAGRLLTGNISVYRANLAMLLDMLQTAL
jgi:hypothetical protein